MFTHVKILIVAFLCFGTVHFSHAQKYWIQLEKPTTRNLNRLSFVDSLRGWVVGDTGTILNTTNGGENWTMQQSGITNDIIDICMIDQNFGWAVAIDLISYGTITLKTTNGGTTWHPKRYPISEKYFYTIEFLDSL